MACNAFFGEILIQCNPRLQDDYEAPDQWFRVVDEKTFFRLLVQPSEYTRIAEGERPAYSYTFGSPMLPAKLVSTGFQVQTIASDMRIRWILEEIVIAAYSPDLRQHTPITVIDGVLPNREAFKQALKSQQPTVLVGSIKTGMIQIEPGNGAVWLNRVGGGKPYFTGEDSLSFKFMQIEKELV